MNDNPPPLLRFRDIPKYFQWKPTYQQLAKWEENDLIHPFRDEPSARALYRTKELAEILNGPKTI